MKVIYSFGKKEVTSILELNCKSFNEVMKEGRINIGWSRCHAREHLRVKVCYKCSGFSHKAGECTRKKACQRCAGEHDIKECESKEVKCVNCVHANAKLIVGIDTNHTTFSRKCTVLTRKLNVEPKKVLYDRSDI